MIRAGFSTGRHPVSKRYARALFEIAETGPGVEKVAAEISLIRSCLEESVELAQSILSPLYPLKNRLNLLNDILVKLGACLEVSRFFRLLLTSDRLRLLPSICDEWEKWVDKKHGVLRGTVTTVEPLSEQDLRGLLSAFEKKFSRKIILESNLDSRVLGGLVVRLGGLTFDGSLSSMMRRVKENLERQSV